MGTLEAAEVHSLRHAAASNLQSLYTSILPLEMKALQLDEEKSHSHPLRSQENIPLWVELHMTASHVWNGAVLVLNIARSHGDETATRALAVMGLDENEKDDFVKANGMRLAAERALRILWPQMPFQVINRGDRS